MDTLRERKFQGTKVPGNESSRERKFQGTFVPGSEKAWVRKGQGANWPGSEKARERKGQGAKVPKNESSRERIGQGPIGRFAPWSELALERKGSVPSICGCQTYKMRRFSVMGTVVFMVRVTFRIRLRFRVWFSDYSIIICSVRAQGA